MKLARPEYKRLKALLHRAWLELNKATDSPDSDVSLNHLANALAHLLVVGRSLHAYDIASISDPEALAFLAGRYRHKVGGKENTPAILEQLQARVARLGKPASAPHLPADTRHSDPLVINESIPAMWRVIHGLRRELLQRRPVSDYFHTALMTCLVLVALGLLFKVATLLLPWGARVIYYRGIDLERPVGISMEPVLFKDYARTRPCLLAGRNNWSARWTGCIRAPESGPYSFYVQCDDGARLWLDDRLVLDNWKDQEWLKSGKEVTVTLSAGSHRIRIEHYKRHGTGAIRVRWTGRGIPANTTLGIPHLFKY